MKDSLVRALRDGYILAVDWQEIDEMLGEDPNRRHAVYVCGNDKEFPPAMWESYIASEAEIREVLKEGGARWIADVYVPFGVIPPPGHIQTRYFSAVQPNSNEPWLEQPE